MSAITPFLLPTDMMANDMAYAIGLNYTKDYSLNHYLGLHTAIWNHESISDDIIQDILIDKPMDFYLYFPLRTYLVAVKKASQEEFVNDFMKRRNHRFIDAFTVIACLKTLEAYDSQNQELKELFLKLLKEDSYNLATYCSNPLIANAYIIYWGIYEGYLDKETYLPLASKHVQEHVQEYVQEHSTDMDKTLLNALKEAIK